MKKIFFHFAATAIVFIAAFQVLSAQAAYMKFDGIPGEFAVQNFTGVPYTVQEFDNARRSGDVKLGDIVVTRVADKSTPKLTQYCADGKHIPKVEIKLVTTPPGKKNVQTYYTYTLENVMVTSYQTGGSQPDVVPTDQISLSTSGQNDARPMEQVSMSSHSQPVPTDQISLSGSSSGESLPMESISLNFSQIKVEYTEQKQNGASRKRTEYVWTR